MTRPKYKAKGQRGSWYATVEGDVLPCAHSLWVKGAKLYCDPYIKRGIAEHDEFIAAIVTAGKVILTKSDLVPGPEIPPTINRDGYIGIFAVGPLTVDDGGLKFELTERLADLK